MCLTVSRHIALSPQWFFVFWAHVMCGAGFCQLDTQAMILFTKRVSFMDYYFDDYYDY